MNINVAAAALLVILALCAWECVRAHRRMPLSGPRVRERDLNSNLHDEDMSA